MAGRYRNLGRGGMGSVWRVLDLDLDREVAVKELQGPDQVTDQERRGWYARMEREARAAARLRHPGIVTVYDRVTGDDGRPWIIMEPVRGRSVDQVLAEQGALSAQQVAALGLAMLDALSAAHAQASSTATSSSSKATGACSPTSGSPRWRATSPSPVRAGCWARPGARIHRAGHRRP
ncbi:protein kinase [Actinomadura sp. LOL_016]|uniref:protein kinase domain-containing protein n=1 Tax=Actinomadura sp. LOL_016 TaxID=3345411 RepID=UPI003A863BE7